MTRLKTELRRFLFLLASSALLVPALIGVLHILPPAPTVGRVGWSLILLFLLCIVLIPAAISTVISTIVVGYRLLQTALHYIIFVETFDRRPPVNKEEAALREFERHVLDVLKAPSESLLNYYKKENLLETMMRESASRVSLANMRNELRLLRKQTSVAKRKLCRPQNAAQHFGFRVPDNAIEIIRRAAK